MKKALFPLLLMPILAMADLGGDLTKAVGIVSDTATKTVKKVSDNQKASDSDKVTTATTAIDGLLKSCSFEALEPVLNKPEFSGVSYRGLEIVEFYSADGGTGSDWGVTFKAAVGQVKKAIPEAKSEKTFKGKDGAMPTTLKIEEDYSNKNQTRLNCYQQPMAGYSD